MNLDAVPWLINSVRDLDAPEVARAVRRELQRIAPDDPDDRRWVLGAVDQLEPPAARRRARKRMA